VLRDTDYDSATSEPGMMVRAGNFEALLRYLSEQCTCLSAENGIPNACKSSRPRVAITFDDGWKDNLDVAWPLAQRYKVPVTIFICPELISSGKTLWTETAAALWRVAQCTHQQETLESIWQRSFNAACPDGPLHNLMGALKEVPPETRDKFISECAVALGPHAADLSQSAARHLLDWTEIFGMAESGVSFGSHTDTHQILTRVAEPAAMKELTSSRATIAQKLKECSMLAYPNGDWSEAIRTLVARCGYQKAFVNQPGIWKQETHPLSIPRINIWDGKLTDKRGLFSIAQLEYSIFWKALRSS
jgi:peptidoglycan/xylan/chitin deacetylase (PgdA/CDA1 family)